MDEVKFSVIPATPQKRSHDVFAGNSEEYVATSATKSSTTDMKFTPRQDSPAPSTMSSLTDLTTIHGAPDSVLKARNTHIKTPPTKKQKLGFVEAQAEKARKQQEKEEKARQRAEEKAKKEEEKAQKDEEKRRAAEEKENTKRAKDLERAEKQKVKEEEKQKKDADKALKDAEKAQKEAEKREKEAKKEAEKAKKEAEKLRKERVSSITSIIPTRY